MVELNKENLAQIEGHLHILLGYAITNPRKITEWADATDGKQEMKVAVFKNVSTIELQEKLNLALKKCTEVTWIFDSQKELELLRKSSSANIDKDDIRMQDDEYHGSKTRSYQYNRQNQNEVEGKIENFLAIYKSDLTEIINLIQKDKLLEDVLESRNIDWQRSLDALKVLSGNSKT